MSNKTNSAPERVRWPSRSREFVGRYPHISSSCSVCRATRSKPYKRSHVSSLCILMIVQLQTSRAPIARDRFPPALDAADGSEDDAGDLGILESKLRSKARLRFKLASEKRLTENVNRIDKSNSREPVRGIGGDEFVGKEVEEDRTTELRNILRQRRSTNETK